jgi:outer membrane murein-binding lipoprotein Lpp
MVPNTRIQVSSLVLACIVISLLLVAGCSSLTSNAGKGEMTAQSTNSPNSTVERVEVIHFHPAQQCYSCRTVGEDANETVNLFFAPELESGKLVFKEVNLNLPENADLVKKYEVTGSSLWIGVYDANGFHKEQNVNVWYKINNKTEFVQYLQPIIRDRINGVIT